MPHPPDRHDDHDTGLVAALAAGDATGADRDQATELVRTCPACAALREDLVLLAAATRALPAPRRTRDYRLSEAQAARLRPAGWRRLLAPFAAPRFRFAAPLGTAMATLGVAGLVLASLPGALPMAGDRAPGALATLGEGRQSGPAPGYEGPVDLAGGSPQPGASGTKASPQPRNVAGSPAAASNVPSAAPSASVRPSAPRLGAASGPIRSPIPSVAVRPARTGAPGPAGTPAPTLGEQAARFSPSGAWSPLAVGSILLVALGVALALARILARRFLGA
jgi:hypothetical protein